MPIFLLCGYGVPQDIRTDTHYPTYLRLAFNHMYELAANQAATIIPCGGPTNCVPPYQGTDAEVMRTFLKDFMGREATKQQTAQWTLHPEEASLSTLENLLFAQRIIEEEGLTGPITIFCEKTREQKLITFAKGIFPNHETRVYAIDFDVSKNRYLDSGLLQEKEAKSTQEGLWTLQSPERLANHHAFFEKKFAFLRQRQSEGLSHVDAVNEWIKNERDVLKELMPDHPFLHGQAD